MSYTCLIFSLPVETNSGPKEQRIARGSMWDLHPRSPLIIYRTRFDSGYPTVGCLCY